MEVSVVLLAHNEASVIADEIRSFNEAILRRLPGSELVVAEDGSRDGTREQIVAVCAEVSLRLLGGQERLGYRRAVLNALESTTSDWVCFCDSGLKHDPGDFWKLWDVREDYDLILGRRVNRRDQPYRRLFTWGYNFLVHRLFPMHLQDTDTGLRLMRRAVATSVLQSGLFFRNFSSSEMVLRATAAGFRCTEIPVTYRQRVGESRGMPIRRIPRSIFGAVSDLLRLRRELRQRYAYGRRWPQPGTTAPARSRRGVWRQTDETARPEG